MCTIVGLRTSVLLKHWDGLVKYYMIHDRYEVITRFLFLTTPLIICTDKRTLTGPNLCYSITPFYFL